MTDTKLVEALKYYAAENSYTETVKFVTHESGVGYAETCISILEDNGSRARKALSAHAAPTVAAQDDQDLTLAYMVGFEKGKDSVTPSINSLPTKSKFENAIDQHIREMPVDGGEVDENEILQVIGERDHAEDVISKIYLLITGKEPEWSNIFGYSNALEEIKDEVFALREKVKELESRYESIEKSAMELRGSMDKISKGSLYDINWMSDGKDAFISMKAIKDFDAALAKIKEGK